MIPAQFDVNRWDTFTQQLDTEARLSLGEDIPQPAQSPATGIPRVQEIYIYRKPAFWHYWPGWGGSREIHHYHPAQGSGRKTEKEKQEDRANLAVWIGGIAAAVAAFAVGYFYTQYQEVKKAHAIAELLKTEANFFEMPQKLREIADKFYEIQERNYSKVLNQTIAAWIALVGGAVTFTGGMAVAPWLITAGQVTLMAATLFGLGNLGVHWSDDQKNKIDWTNILRKIPDARAEAGMPPLYTASGAV